MEEGIVVREREYIAVLDRVRKASEAARYSFGAVSVTAFGRTVEVTPGDWGGDFDKLANILCFGSEKRPEDEDNPE